MPNSSKQTSIHIKTFVQINYIKFFFFLLAFIIVIFSIYSLIPILNAIIISLIIGYLVNPIVIYFERKQIGRIWAILLVFGIVIAIFCSLGIFLKNLIPSSADITSIQKQIMHGLDTLKINLTSRYPEINWNSLNSILFDKIKSNFNLAGSFSNIISNVSDTVSLFMVVPFILFYFLLKGPQIERSLLSLVPNKYFEMTLLTFREIDYVFGSYIRGTLIECFVIGVLTTFGWYLCGFPLVGAVIGGTSAGLANAIPYVGPLIGGIVGVFMYLLKLIPQGNASFLGISPSLINIIVIVCVVQFIDQFLKPAILGKSVNLHPLLVFIGIIAGGKLFGFIGMLLAIPVIAVFKVVLGTLYKQLKGFGFLSNNIISVITKGIEDN